MFFGVSRSVTECFQSVTDYLQPVTELGTPKNMAVALPGMTLQPLYFEPIWTLLPEDVAVLNPTGYRTLKRRYPACVRHQNGFSHIVMVWYVVLKIGT